MIYCGYVQGGIRNPCLHLMGEVAAANAADGRRDNAPFEFLLVLRYGFSPSVGFADSPLVRGGRGTDGRNLAFL